jgi:HEAT repeats
MSHISITEKIMQELETTLKKLAKDTEPISVASLYTFSGIDQTDAEKIDRAWPTIPTDRRQAAMKHLVEIAEKNFEVDFNSVYRIGLTDPDPEVRAAAIDGIWEDNDTALIAPLIRFLQQDPTEAVRAAAATGLGQFVLSGEYEEIPPAKLEPVLEALRSIYLKETESLEVRRRALESLAYHTFDELPGFIRTAYEHPNERMRIGAVQAMGRSSDEQWSAIVVRELESTHPEMRFEAAQACGELEIPAAVKPLVELIEDVDDQVQKAAVWALGQVGGDLARRALTAILDSDQDYLHEEAEDALAELDFNSGNLAFKVLDFDDVDTVDEDEEWLMELVDEDAEDDESALDH